MRSGTLHIAPLLFSIYHKASSMSKYGDQIWLSHRGSFVKDGKEWGSIEQGPLRMLFFC